MGKQLLSSQTPPAGDQANSVVSGTFTGVGTSGPFGVYGWFNVAVWGSVATSLTTTSGSSSATVSSGTGLTQGMGVNSPAGNVPPGTTLATVSGTNVTLAFPPGFTAANVTGGTDAAASFGTVAVAGTLQLERTFDGGSTWVIHDYPPTGGTMVFTNPGSVSLILNEVERGVFYRINCVGYTSGTVNYRLSGSGLANTAFGPRG